MSRTPTNNSAVVVIPLNETYVERTEASAGDEHQAYEIALKRTEALRREIGFNGVMTRESLEDEAKFLVRRTAECAMELGKRLLILREMSAHGEWSPTLSRIGVNERAAQRVMSAVRRLTNASTSTHLLAAAGTQSKLFEVLLLDDDELAALSTGESAAGLTLDDVDRMPVSELRATIRAAKERQKAELAAKDKVIEQQQSSITAKQEFVAHLEHRVAKSTPDEIRLTLSQSFTHATELVRANLHTGFELAARELIQHGEVIGSPEEEIIAGALKKLGADILAVAQRLGLNIADDFSWATE